MQCKRLVYTVALAMSVISLCGCGKSKEVDEVTSVESKAKTGLLDYTVSENYINAKKSYDTVYSVKDKMPLMSNGHCYGWIRIQQVERLGINDWTNKKAVEAGINFSYTINFRLDYLDPVSDTDQKVIYCLPVLMDDNKTVGESCIVGWSGFSETFQVSKGQTTSYMEYGVQPVSKITKNTKLVLVLSDSDGVQYDDICINRNALKTAKKGPVLIKSKMSNVIKSINGAKFKTGISKVYAEPNFIETSDSVKYAFMFHYRISYLKKPTNSRDVAMFDPRNKNMLRIRSVLGVQSNIGDEVLYNNDTSLTVKAYRNSDQREYYVPFTYLMIHPGYYADYGNNRVVSQVECETAEYLRVRCEFPEEVVARTPAEMLKFNGRFVVFQQKITDRVLHSEESGKRNSNVVATNDRKAKEDNSK